MILEIEIYFAFKISFVDQFGHNKLRLVGNSSKFQINQ